MQAPWTDLRWGYVVSRRLQYTFTSVPPGRLGGASVTGQGLTALPRAFRSSCVLVLRRGGRGRGEMPGTPDSYQALKVRGCRLKNTGNHFKSIFSRTNV